MGGALSLLARILPCLSASGSPRYLLVYKSITPFVSVFFLCISTFQGHQSYGIRAHFPGGSEDKASACNAGDPGLTTGLGRSPGEGNGNPLQYSCLENPMDREAWWATVHGVPKSWTRLSDFTLRTLLTDYIYKDPIFKLGHILRHRGVRLQRIF